MINQMNIIRRLLSVAKDAFFVVDDYVDNGKRWSKTMLAGIAGIVVGIGVAFEIIPVGAQSEVTAAVLGVLTSGWNAIFMWLRISSPGGTSILQDGAKSNGSNGDGAVGNEHHPATTNDDPRG